MPHSLPWLGSLGSQAGPIGGPEYDRNPNGMPMGLLRVLRRPEADMPGLVPATTAGRTEHLLGMLQGRAGARPGAPGSPGAPGDSACPVYSSHTDPPFEPFGPFVGHHAHVYMQ